MSDELRAEWIAYARAVTGPTVPCCSGVDVHTDDCRTGKLYTAWRERRRATRGEWPPVEPTGPGTPDTIESLAARIRDLYDGGTP
jgi:hypothetical protein